MYKNRIVQLLTIFSCLLNASLVQAMSYAECKAVISDNFKCLWEIGGQIIASDGWDYMSRDNTYVRYDEFPGSLMLMYSGIGTRVLDIELVYNSDFQSLLFIRNPKNKDGILRRSGMDKGLYCEYLKASHEKYLEICCLYTIEQTPVEQLTQRKIEIPFFKYYGQAGYYLFPRKGF